MPKAPKRPPIKANINVPAGKSDKSDKGGKGGNKKGKC